MLALTDTSGSLHHLILEQVIDRTILSCFLRRNQYVLRNDNFGNFGRLFSNKEATLLYRAFEAVRNRHDDRFYEHVKPFLGTLLARIWQLPRKILEKYLPSDFGIPNPTKRPGYIKGLYHLDWIRRDYDSRLSVSWMHQLILFKTAVSTGNPFTLSTPNIPTHS